MQISSNASSVAARQIQQSTEMLNQLNQMITDKSQDVSNKLIKVAVTDKLQTQEQQSKIDLLA
ncbi:MAG: hypothetical protein KDK39_00885 [Leptospiraceae bacterium]|nr:hypothetical protein [Leptospiraceae bacterium]